MNHDCSRRARDDESNKQVRKGPTIKFNAHRFVTQQVGKLLVEYTIGDMLRSGGFGEVYLGKHKKSGAERAIKVVSKSPKKDDHDNLAVLYEFNVVRKLDHPNILKMYNLYQDDNHFYIGKDKLVCLNPGIVGGVIMFCRKQWESIELSLTTPFASLMTFCYCSDRHIQRRRSL